MPFARAPDGVKLYYEECGARTPVLFVHEYAGDYRSWEPQVRRLCRRTAASRSVRAATRLQRCRSSEEPAAFNQALLQFFAAVESRRWMAHRAMALDD